jgi:hypothetical protein
MKKETPVEYIRVTEISKKRVIDIYDGVLIFKDKETFKAILQGPENDGPIRLQEFDLEDWTISELTKEKVQKAWDLAEIESQIGLLKAEFDMKLAQNKFDITKEYMEKYLK